MASVDSTFAPQWKYDVFLSFRGEDTGKTFTDHLYTALDENGFYAFRDDEKHEKREEIAPEFLTAIEESKISILVFSKNYASSRWCLDELETVIKSMKKPGRMVMPVFYHVDASEVRDQIGSCEVFSSHQRDAEETKEKVNRWRAALREASNLVGWPLHNQYESQLIKEIITDILRRLNCELLQVDYDTVGMEFRLKKLLSLINLKLDKVLMIGINGISGIGKTTIAKAIYNKISYHFQSTIFLTNVGENSRGHHLNLSQFHQLLDDASIGTHGRTKNKRVLLVVDDVDRLSQVEYLVKLRDSFSLRSRIIFTTRDRHLLNVAKLDASFESKGLTHEEAIHLFSWHAFKQTFPKEDYVGLVNHVVGYVKGHPLALKVLGSSLFGKTITEWKCILHKLRKNTHGEIYNELKVSFDGLTPTEQEIFLKVVCLLKGKDEESVSTILDSLGLGSESGIQVLHDMCLATISNNKLYMHDLLQQMGQKLIDENNPHEPSKRSRLQDSKDVYPQLTRNTGTEEIQKIQFSSAGFLKMPKLYSLMHLPLKSLPPNFPGDSLILLDLSRSNIRQLWKGNKILGNLKVMNLSYCQNLVKISKFPSMPALKILSLEGCKMLRSLPSSICELKCLECLWCSGCSNLEAFPEITEKMENLKELHLNETAIKLEHLDLSFCNDLVIFPAINSQLCGLRFLGLSHCKRLQSHPELLSSIESADAHHCTCLKTLPFPSLSCLPCAENEPPSCVSREFDIFISGNGMCSKTELPMNWYEQKGFLGFVLCSVYVPLDAASGHESENTFDDISQNEYAHTSKNESEDEFENSPVGATHTCLWIRNYPKVALKKKYFSNEWSHLIASFKGYHNGTPLKVKECGVYLIYARSDQHYNLLAESLDDAGSIVVESDSFDVGCKTLRSLPSSICELKCLEHQVFWLFKPREELESRSCLSCPENDPSSNVTRGFNILTSGSRAILKWFGFALCTVYVQLDAESCHEFEKQSENKFNDKSQKEYAHTPKNESDDEFESSPIDATYTYRLECKLTYQIGGVDFLAFAPPLCECYFNGGSSKQVWIRYYPKVALKKKYLSNEWGHLTASFKGYHSGIPLKVKECGVHLIYA
ncbi:hypothetical protein AAG906_021067 [Vitis piasezkii]